MARGKRTVSCHTVVGTEDTRELVNDREESTLSLRFDPLKRTA